VRKPTLLQVVIKAVILVFLCLIPLFAWAYAYDRTTERAAFLAALGDLQRGKQQQFLEITEHLRDYPLYPYLLYADLAMHLPEAPTSDIQGFLDAYSNTPLASHLRGLWLQEMASQGRWQQFLQVYQPTSDLNLQCDQREALLATGQTQAAIENFDALLGKTQVLPKSCLIVFEQALRSGNLAQSILWQRIEMAMQANNMMLASQFADILSPNDKALFVVWQHIYQNPLLITQAGLLKLTGSVTEPIVLTAIQRLADKDPRLAVAVWKKLYSQYTLPEETQQKVTRILALALAQDHDPLAEPWLMQLAPEYVDQTVREWRIRAALLNQDWAGVQNAIILLPPEEQHMPAWRYWYARALAAQGQGMTAQTIYRDLALHGDFYGQMASLQLHQVPLAEVKNLTVSRDQIIAIANLPAMQRAYELYQLHWLPEAHQEWQWAIQNLPEEDYLAAAELAINWGWFERAIATVNLLSDGSNIPLRFPLAYRTEVLGVAERQDLNPAWLFALIRQESLFTPDAHSSAGAIGLMQLMPTTAMLIADKLHMSCSVDSLCDADLNLTLGGVYLRHMDVLFNGNVLFATAAYNAGPGRVQKWIPQASMPADIWIETIPFHETRDYVKNITAATTFYEKELGISPTLAWRMQPV
jgi:soluble lytic murein transglycosylase